jgi:hypothetical protein
MEVSIRQDDHFLLELGDQGVKGGIIDIGRATLPIYHQPTSVNHKGQFPAYSNTVVSCWRVKRTK